jgi:Cu(I)/Ag(I) efflux system membrane fusion protein
MKLLTTLMFAIMLTAASVAGCGVSEMYPVYGDLQERLAADDFKGAQAATTKLVAAYKHAQEEELPALTKGLFAKHEKALGEHITKASKAGDIKTLRVAFHGISNIMIEMAETVKPAEFGRFRCPMAFDYEGADWLQKGTVVNNPYFGAEMLRCGHPVKAQKKRGAGQHHKHDAKNDKGDHGHQH